MGLKLWSHHKRDKHLSTIYSIVESSKMNQKFLWTQSARYEKIYASLCLQSLSAFFDQIQNGLTPVFDHSLGIPFPGTEEVLFLKWNRLTFGEV